MGRRRKQGMILYHGTSSVLMPSIRKIGIHRPCLAESYEIAEYYAEEAVADCGGEKEVLEIQIRDTSKLRYDGAAMDEPVMTGEDQRDAAWDKAAVEHPEWVERKIIMIPREAWWVSLEGAGSVWFEGTIKKFKRV